MADEIEFVNGLIVKAPHEKAPDFVKASISIKITDLIEWLQGREGDWVNLDVKESKNGKWYAAVNTFKKEEKPKGNAAPKKSDDPFADFTDDIPF